MPKIKVLSRNPDHYVRETKMDINRVPRNYDPTLHPFMEAREYTHALNAVKLERVFAKPFIGSLDGHKDGISYMVKHPRSLSTVVSGCFDGEVRFWDLAQKKCTRSFQAHDGIVRGMTFNPEGSYLYSVGNDKVISRWKTDEDGQPENQILSKYILSGITHHQKEEKYATCGEKCQLWDASRANPMKTFDWGVDTLNYIAFNPIETTILGSCGSDRSIILYDTREAEPLRRVVMSLRSNAIAWNPMEAYVFVAANEDYNLYSFDMRNLKSPVNVHMDHISAVTTVDYAPTGKEFVSGSYDKTIRIFKAEQGRSREVYHTKRMQRLTFVLWTSDNKYIISGSDEMNLRIWKARASEKLGILHHRQRAALNYNNAVKEKYLNHPQVRRIDRHRQIPKHVYSGQKELNIIRQSKARKESNRRTHSKSGSVPFVAERKKHTVKEER